MAHRPAHHGKQCLDRQRAQAELGGRLQRIGCAWIANHFMSANVVITLSVQSLTPRTCVAKLEKTEQPHTVFLPEMAVKVSGKLQKKIRQKIRVDRKVEPVGSGTNFLSTGLEGRGQCPPRYPRWILFRPRASRRCEGCPTTREKAHDRPRKAHRFCLISQGFPVKKL